MRTLVTAVAVSLVVPLFCLAGESVGRLTATKGARLDGIYLPTAGIPSWPVHPGSVIKTGDYPAIIMLNGGGRFEVAPNSTALVERPSVTGSIVRMLETSAVPNGSEPTMMAAASAAPAQVRTSAATAPPVAELIPISIVDKNPKAPLGPPPAGPPCSGFPPILVTLGLVRCTP